MNVRYILFALAMLFVHSSLNSSYAIEFFPEKLIFVSDDSDRDFISDAMDPGPLDDEGNIVARERQDVSQDNLQIRTFVEFDLSAISAENVANPGFSATFGIDFVTRLNTVNDMGVVLGRVQDDGIAGDSWGTEEGVFPLYEWGGENAADTVTVVDNIKTDPLGARLVDVTGIVRDWVNGVHDNNGFVLSGSGDAFQGAGLNNARLVTGLFGDFDDNGSIEVADFQILSDHLAAHLDGEVAAADGDMDFDGDVDLDDFGLFKEVFPDVVAQAVPEPTTAFLAAGTLFGLLLTRRRW